MSKGKFFVGGSLVTWGLFHAGRALVCDPYAQEFSKLAYEHPRCIDIISKEMFYVWFPALLFVVPHLLFYARDRWILWINRAPVPHTPSSHPALAASALTGGLGIMLSSILISQAEARCLSYDRGYEAAIKLGCLNLPRNVSISNGACFESDYSFCGNSNITQEAQTYGRTLAELGSKSIYFQYSVTGGILFTLLLISLIPVLKEKCFPPRPVLAPIPAALGLVAVAPPIVPPGEVKDLVGFDSSLGP